MYRATGNTTDFKDVIITREKEASAPVITIQPVSAQYKQNSTAEALTVAATASSGTLTYQWYSNTTNSTDGATAIDGATAAAYTPSTATLGTTYYFCAVADASGTTNSNIATITISNTDTFGITNADLTASTGLETSTTYNGSIVTLTMSNASHGGSSSTRAVTNGTNNVTAAAAACQRNTLCSGASNFVEDSYYGFTMTVASGYKINLSKIYGDLYYESSRSGKYKFAVYAAGSKVWEASSSDHVTTGGSNKSTKTLDVSNVEALQNLTGTVQVRMVWYQNGSSSYVALKDFNCVTAIEEDARTTYTMTVSANDDAMGTVSPENGSTIVEGESVTFTATPNTGYKFEKWTIDGTVITENPYTLEGVMAEHTAVATFTALYKVTYDIDDYDNTVGKVLNNVDYGEVYADANDKYTIPTYAHLCLYREGYILSGWSDGMNNYATGDELTLTSDITLVPTWKATTQTLAATAEDVTITWNLAYEQYLFNAWQGTGAVGYYTKPQTVNGEIIAVPMIIDATSGKIDNSKRANEGNTQVNQNTKFTIPAVSGMIITIADASTVFSSTTIANSTEYEGNGTKSISYTYEGSDATIDIVIGENNQYLKTIKVTYPATIVTKTIGTAGYATFCADVPVSFEGSGVTAYIATLSGSKVSFSKVTSVPANTGVLLKGTAGEKTFTVAESSTDVSANKFVGVTVDTEVNGGIFVLMAGTDDNQGTGFYKTTAKFTVGANTAYLPADLAEARTFIGFDNESTGINEVPVAENAQGKVYNLQGVRVAKPTKGLYIENGKKVIIK
ncbi:MAG: hypothetical protein J6W19_09555 [Prevotella sp.]|nr:hypothetical protein [Prevotella sp.]